MDQNRELHQRIDARNASHDELLDLARQGPDACVRAHAAAVIADDTLFAAAIADHKEDTRASGMWYDGIRAIGSADVLYRLARALPDKEHKNFARQLAAQSATLEQALQWLHDSDPEIRAAMCSRGAFYNDWSHDKETLWETALAQVALEDPDPDVRWWATYRISDATLLLKILASSTDPKVRILAVKPNIGRKQLVQLSLHDQMSNVRVAALKEIAAESPEPDEIEFLTRDADDRIAAAAANCVRRADTISRILSDKQTNATAARLLNGLPGWRVIVAEEYGGLTIWVVPPSQIDVSALIRGCGTHQVDNADPLTGLTFSIAFDDAQLGKMVAPLLWSQRGFARGHLSLPPGTYTKAKWTGALWANSIILATVEPQRSKREESHIYAGDPQLDTAKRWDGDFEHPEGRICRLLIRTFQTRVFISYSRSDLDIVRFASSFGRTLPMYRLNYDLELLRSGDDWEQKIKSAIRSSHIFQLFWSKAAAASKAVEHEWRYALSLKRKGFICPVHWETDHLFPPPPTELAAINFQRIQIPPHLLEERLERG